jgi:two-component system chemotaxis response regulator CheY
MPEVNLADLKVLVVEPDAQFRAILRDMLFTCGIAQVDDAPDGYMAMDVLRRFPADMALVARDGPGMNGIDFLRRLRSTPRHPQRALPVIFTTPAPNLNQVAEARDAGVHELLVKPFSVNALKTRIAAMLLRPRPFIEAQTYCGPDRRRRGGIFTGPERRRGRNEMAAALAAG